MLVRKASPFQNKQQELHAGTHGMKLFLISLGMLFGATIVGFFVMRAQIAQWPDDLPPMPTLLWASTVLLIGSSLTAQAALNAVRNGNQSRCKRFIIITLGVGLAFLAAQTWCWLNWLADSGLSWSDGTIVRFALTAFFVLTGVHAAHVIGGLVPMILMLSRAPKNNGTVNESTMLYCTMYWHFLDAVWIVLFAVLLLFV